MVPQGLEPTFEAIAGHVNLLLKDRDCFQIGQGSPSAFLPRFGAFAGKEDLGRHAYVTDPKVIAMHDNMVAINNALSVDLTGQINAEVIFGNMLINGPGGQPDSHLGALLLRSLFSITAKRWQGLVRFLVYQVTIALASAAT